MDAFDWSECGNTSDNWFANEFGNIINRLLKRLCHILFAHYDYLEMIRAALFQSVRCASRTAVRAPLPTSRIVTPCLSVRSAVYTPTQVPQARRWYSAPAGLSKQEVEGRIMDLLKGFDKVGSLGKLSPNSC